MFLFFSESTLSDVSSCFSFLQVVVQVKPVYTPPQLFPIGKETITYIGTDRSGNQANCSFTVTVIGELIPPATNVCANKTTYILRKYSTRVETSHLRSPE